MGRRIRGKMVVESVTHYDYPAVLVTMECRYDRSIPEDQRFAKATPSGDLRMQIDNPDVIELMKPGKSFYIDFVPVEE